MAKSLGVSQNTIRKWRDRFSYFITNNWSSKWTDQDKKREVIKLLSDAPRSGRKPTFNAQSCCKIMALAVRSPSDFGRVISHWSLTELRDEILKQKMVSSISRSSVGRILQEVDIRPHKSRYWLTPKVDNEEEFLKRIQDVCEVYKDFSQREDTTVYSVDEKTGIQALEFINPSKPVQPGSPEKIEFEYKRHGTLCLIPSFNVATGRVDQYRIGETRNEQDFSDHIVKTIAQSKGKNIIFVADQLNTHKSETLVRLIAKECQIDEKLLGEKGKSGILKDQNSRMKFLEDRSHKIRFVFTPKHCSWLNQVEIWFGVLSRKFLKRSSFTSKKELERRIRAFIDYFNENLAKPYRWTYEGKALKK